jgi:S-phase kinase-associated protein 1
MKPYVWTQTMDAFSQKVEAIAIFCPMICCEVVQNVKGSLENYAVSIPSYDTTTILGLLLDYY